MHHINEISRDEHYHQWNNTAATIANAAMLVATGKQDDIQRRWWVVAVRSHHCRDCHSDDNDIHVDRHLHNTISTASLHRHRNQWCISKMHASSMQTS